MWPVPRYTLPHHERHVHSKAVCGLDGGRAARAIRVGGVGSHETQIDAQRLSGNWYLHHAEIPFNKILKLEVLDAINWVISSEVIEGPQKFLRIPGQQKYFVKQQDNDELVIIEILDYTTIIMKKFDVANNRFEEAIYQKRDIG